MLYDNGGLPAPQRPKLPMPGFTSSGNAMPTGIVAGQLPPPKLQTSLYQPMQPNRPGVLPPPKLPMQGTYPGYPQPRQSRYRTLRNKLAMTNGMPSLQPQYGGMQQRPMGYGRPLGQTYQGNPMATQFQYMMPQYQGNPYLPAVQR